jgi:predicted phosphoribosyltransferase
MSERIIEKAAYRNRSGLFTDRFQAGSELAELLAPDLAGLEQGLVLAIPSGGVPIGLQLSRRLDLPLDVFIVRKPQIPGNTEAGFGAVTLDGDVLLNQELLSRLGLGQKEIQAEIARVTRELQERNRVFRGGKPHPDVCGKTVILADDGLASGYTMLAAAKAVRSRQASRVIVAVPTAPLSSVQRALEVADAVYSLHIQDRGGSFAVASAYTGWRDLSREEVAAMLDRHASSGMDGP